MNFIYFKQRPEFIQKFQIFLIFWILSWVFVTVLLTCNIINQNHLCFFKWANIAVCPGVSRIIDAILTFENPTEPSNNEEVVAEIDTKPLYINEVFTAMLQTHEIAAELLNINKVSTESSNFFELVPASGSFSSEAVSFLKSIFLSFTKQFYDKSCFCLL